MKYKAVRSLPYLKQYLKENNITQTDIMDMTGLSDTTISDFVNGKSGSKGTVRLIARELEINQALISQVVYLEKS